VLVSLATIEQDLDEDCDLGFEEPGYRCNERKDEDEYQS
jgi:hypothetical protein